MGLKAIDKGLVAGRNKEKQKGKEEEEGEETEKDGDWQRRRREIRKGGGKEKWEENEKEKGEERGGREEKPKEGKGVDQEKESTRERQSMSKRIQAKKKFLRCSTSSVPTDGSIIIQSRFSDSCVNLWKKSRILPKLSSWYHKNILFPYNQKYFFIEHCTITYLKTNPPIKAFS